MSANDPGHINNLNKNQIEILKTFWIDLINTIENENNFTSENIFESIIGKELIYSFGYENPDVILLRFIRARKWNINQALQQLIDTLKWRHQFGVNELVEHGENQLYYQELVSGKTFHMGNDLAGRPINYVSAKDHIKGEFPHEATEKLTVLSMEIGRKLLHSPIESVTVLIDMTDFSMKNMDYQHVKFLINLLENCYPEVLGLGLVVNAPWIFTSCWNIIKSWLDPIVESKIHFIKNLNDLPKYIDLSNLPKRLNGYQPDYNYIPPTDEDQSFLSILRDDHYGKSKAKGIYREAAQNYLDITFKWAENNEKNFLLEERKKAENQLRDAYEQFIPYISSRTHYHRNGTINEPIFDITFKQIEEKNKEKIVHF